jgi:hypothetical protein
VQTTGWNKSGVRSLSLIEWKAIAILLTVATIALVVSGNIRPKPVVLFLHSELF